MGVYKMQALVLLSKIIVFFLFCRVHGKIVDFEEYGGIADDMSNERAWENGRLMNESLNSLEPGDIFLVPNKTFLVMGGIKVYNLSSFTFQLDGTIMFSDNMDEWPRESNGDVFECIHFINIDNATFTSSGVGTLDGNGETWWGLPGIGYLVRGENMLFERITASGVGLTIGSIGTSVVNNITFRDSYMHHTFKGIYTKFRGDNGRISNVLFENIYIEAPEQWAIWIGPAQQSDSSSLCAAHPCSLCWPQLANVGAECNIGNNNV